VTDYATLLQRGRVESWDLVNLGEEAWDAWWSSLEQLALTDGLRVDRGWNEYGGNEWQAPYVVIVQPNGTHYVAEDPSLLEYIDVELELDLRRLEDWGQTLVNARARVAAAEAYRTLLADGAVGYEIGSFRAGSHRQWASELVALAESDDLQAALRYMHADDADFEVFLHADDQFLDNGGGATHPCVHLTGDQLSGHGSNIYPYDQQTAAAWYRPRADAACGETLVAARARHSS
jgi:hypothetical protein